MMSDCCFIASLRFPDDGLHAPVVIRLISAANIQRPDITQLLATLAASSLSEAASIFGVGR